jgi:hypothetical protein
MPPKRPAELSKAGKKPSSKPVSASAIKAEVREQTYGPDLGDDQWNALHKAWLDNKVKSSR